MKLFEPLLTNKIKKNPVWLSWVKHVEYVDMMLNRSTYKLADVVALDMAVYESVELFNKVPEYKGFFKPKHHFASHASVNILRMGPMRGCAPLIHTPPHTLPPCSLTSHAHLASTCTPCIAFTPRITCTPHTACKPCI